MREDLIDPSDPDGGATLRGDRETPFRSGNALLLTEDERRGVHAFIRELKPGVYIKCTSCQKMKYGSESHATIGSNTYCGECIDNA